MTRRPLAQAQLDTAVERSVVTLVRGLPRVGRSSLFADWLKYRTDARRADVAALAPEPGIFVVDHVEEASVHAIIAAVRVAEEARSHTRFVVAPIDLRATELLRTMLPGVVELVEIVPLCLDEVADEASPLSAPSGPLQLAPTVALLTGSAADPRRHWLRGGLPESLARSDADSLQWRQAMLDALFARNYTAWDVARAFPLGDVLHWLANRNGGELEENGCPFAKRQELKSAVYVLELLGVVRRLTNCSTDDSASLGRKQKVFIRDTGILHAALGIVDWPQLRSHASIGNSFESYAIEALILAGAGRCGAKFYREKGEDEIDLVLDFPTQNGRLVAIEVKVGEGQSAKKGFYTACKALGIEDRFVVHSGDTATIGAPVDRLDLNTAMNRVRRIAQDG